MKNSETEQDYKQKSNEAEIKNLLLEWLLLSGETLETPVILTLKSQFDYVENSRYIYEMKLDDPVLEEKIKLAEQVKYLDEFAEGTKDCLYTELLTGEDHFTITPQDVTSTLRWSTKMLPSKIYYPEKDIIEKKIETLFPGKMPWLTFSNGDKHHTIWMMPEHVYEVYEKKQLIIHIKKHTGEMFIHSQHPYDTTFLYELGEGIKQAIKESQMKNLFVK